MPVYRRGLCSVAHRDDGLTRAGRMQPLSIPQRSSCSACALPGGDCYADGVAHATNALGRENAHVQSNTDLTHQ